MMVLKLSLLGLALSAGPILACAVVPPVNQPVAIANESAIIIWDSANKTEHFIRRASFQTMAKDFGFLVPTPAQPELAEAVSPLVGKLAEDFTLFDLDGRKQRLSALRGKVVLLDFWATWCGPCRREMPTIQKLHRVLWIPSGSLTTFSRR